MEDTYYLDGTQNGVVVKDVNVVFPTIFARHQFIKKVYSILFVQLLVTFGIVTIFSLIDPVREFVFQNVGLLWLAIILSFGFLITLACCNNVARSYPTNYIMLSLFTLCEGYLLGAISATYQTESVMYAVLMTIVVTLGLTLFAMQTKYDFTGAGGYLLGGLIVLIMFGLLSSIFCTTQENCHILNMVYAGIGALIFSMYIVYDTQLIVGGAHKKYQFDANDHVFASLSLYLDVINLFIYILQLMKNKRK